MHSRQPRHSTAAVNAPLAPTIALSIQSPHTLRRSLSKAWMRNSRAVTERHKGIQTAIDANFR